jgi:hypothetical protein
MVSHFSIPKNLEFETIGQFQDLKAEAVQIKDAKSFDKYALFCAIYATNPYDYQEAEKLVPTFINAPCEEVMAIGNFILLKLAELMTGIQSKSQSPSIPMKKYWLVLTVWLKTRRSGRSWAAEAEFKQFVLSAGEREIHVGLCSFEATPK